MALSYDSRKAFDYARQWCKGGNDCTSGQYNDSSNTDCTHFISHVLKAGGVIVKGTDRAKCNSGLCIRVKDLAIWFSVVPTRHQNVKRLSGWRDARKGDFCFQRATILGLNLTNKHHIMLLADSPKENGANVFGHQNNRCGEFIEFDVPNCVYYRIE